MKENLVASKVTVQCSLSCFLSHRQASVLMHSTLLTCSTLLSLQLAVWLDIPPDTKQVIFEMLQSRNETINKLTYSIILEYSNSGITATHYLLLQ